MWLLWCSGGSTQNPHLRSSPWTLQDQSPGLNQVFVKKSTSGNRCAASWFVVLHTSCLLALMAKHGQHNKAKGAANQADTSTNNWLRTRSSLRKTVTGSLLHPSTENRLAIPDLRKTQSIQPSIHQYVHARIQPFTSQRRKTGCERLHDHMMWWEVLRAARRGHRCGRRQVLGGHCGNERVHVSNVECRAPGQTTPGGPFPTNRPRPPGRERSSLQANREPARRSQCVVAVSSRGRTTLTHHQQAENTSKHEVELEQTEKTSNVLICAPPPAANHESML